MSPAKFRAFTDILFSESGIENVSEMISAKAAQLGKTDAYKGLSENALNDIAYSEVTAEMMETALTDTDVLSRISSRLQQTDKSLWGKIKDFLKGLVERLKAAYQGMNPDSSIARLARQSIQSSENALNAFADAASDAIVNYNLQDGESVVAGTVVDRDGESVDYLNSNRVTDKKTLDFLDGQETVTTYKTMQLVDGKLYPPMAAVVAGSYEDHSVLGQWEAATEHPELIKLDKSGKPKFTLNKGKGKGSLAAAYNPYMHSSNLVLNDQFSGAYDRPNLVTVECKVPVSELTSGYKAQYAKDSVGWHAWHTGTVAGALRQKTGIERQVLLSRWIMPVRILSDAEVAGMYAELLNGTGIAVPDNVVPPKLLTELKKAGVEITESGRLDGQKNNAQEGVRYSKRYLEASENQELAALTGKVASGNFSGNDRVYLSNVSASNAKRIQELTGIDVTGFRVAIEARQIEHILNGHGANGDTDHSMADIKNVAKMEYTLNNPDSIILAGTTRAYVTYRDGKNRPAKTVLYEKSIGEKSYYVVQAVADTKSKTLYIVSAFIGEQGYKKGALQFTDAQSPGATSKNAAVDTLAPKVAQPDADVKQNIRNSSRMDSTGRELSKGQVEYFANSEVRDEDGNLIPVYHSTYDEFYTFDRSKLGGWTLKNASDAGIAATSLIGHWFSDHDLTDAMGGHAIQAYLNIENPYTVDLDTLAAEISSYAEDPGQMQEDFEYGDYEQVRQAADSFTEWLREEGYDGLIVADTEFGGTSYVVLDSAQAKLTTNKAPTASQDTRFSSRQSQEVKQALEDYRYQRDVEFKAMKAVYDAERSQIEQAHRREMKALEDSYKGEAAKASEKFVQLMREYEEQGLSREKLEQELSEQADKLAKANGNAAYWKRQFNELMADYDASGRSIDRLENKIKKQQQDAKAKVENAKKVEERLKLERVISDINRRLLSPTKTLYVPDSLQPAVTTAMQSIATIQQQGAAETARKVTERYEEILARLQKNPVKNAKAIEETQARLANILARQQATVQNSLDRMQDAYAELTRVNQGVFTQEFNEGIMGLIQDAKNAIGDTFYGDLSIDQLKAVRDAYTGILIKNQKIFRYGRIKLQRKVRIVTCFC